MKKRLYEIWDKQSPINGVDAQVVLNEPLFNNASEIILIKNEHNLVSNIEIATTIREVLGVSQDTPVELVAEMYIQYLEQMDNCTEDIQNEERSYPIRIEKLEKEKKELLEITKEQDKMIMDNAYKMLMLESTLGGIK